MAYERTIWKNREVEHPRRYTITDNGDGTVTLQPSPGNIIEPGTPIIAANMNNIEEGILYAIEHAGKVKSVNGKTGEVVIDVEDIEGLNVSSIILGKNAKEFPSPVDSGNIVIGENAESIESGALGIAIGYGAKVGNTGSAAVGITAEVTAFRSVALGYGAKAINANTGVLGVEDISWQVPGSFTVSGTKNFEIPHPKPEKSATHVIRHGAVESPTPGDTLYRWKIQATKDNDLVAIDLPDYFVWLNKDVQIFVTPQGHFGNGYGDLNRETEQLQIHCQFAGEYNVLVIGTRNDDHQSVQDWDIKGVEREIGESWTGETYVFEVDEIMEVEEIKEVI